MAEIAIFEAGGYRYIRGPFQYSGGVAAQPGHAIERVRFRERPGIDDGFQAIEAYLTGLGRPLTAFCACELRSPAPFTEEGFITDRNGARSVPDSMDTDIARIRPLVRIA